jgi:hypothetical protein
MANGIMKTSFIRQLVAALVVASGCMLPGSSAHGQSKPEGADVWDPKLWEEYGFPQGIDRQVRLTMEQHVAFNAFFSSMEKAILHRKNDDDIEGYANIVKVCLTPMPGDDPEWSLRFTVGEIRSFAGTRYAPEIAGLLRPVFLSATTDHSRANIAMTMALLGDKSIIENVLPLLASDDEIVRKLAHRILRKMGYDVPSPWDDKPVIPSPGSR